jgi:AraC-like DNA-binding protein
MNFDEFSSDLPPQQTEWFTTPEALESALDGYGIIQPTLQFESGQFRAGLAQRKTESCELFADRYSTALSLQLCPPRDNISILMPRSVSGRFMASGFDLAKDNLLVFPDGAMADISGPGPIGSDDIAIPEARFFEMLATLCPAASWSGELTIVKVDQPYLATLGDEVVRLIGKPDAELHSERLSNLLVSIISLIGHGSGQKQTEELKGSEARSRVARKARKYIEGNFRHPVHLESLCRETGTGIRSLQRCFREYFDFNITDYLKTVRLDSVFRELLAASPDEETVTQIALHNGFTHLGRFSIAFNRRFSVLPSEVLQMRAD